MKLIQKNFLTILFFVLISVTYFGLRLPNLTLQPIFADEAIYIRWAQVMKSEPTLRFLPLSDGKTPLYMWTLIPFFKIFEDPLFAGRFLSILSGFATLTGAFVIGLIFFNKKIALWAAFLISITPYIVFFDRMALVDSMLSAFTIWSLLAALLLARYPRIDLAMVLGYLLGGGMLTKPPGFFNILILPASALLLNFKDKTKRQLRALRIFGLWLIAIFITIVIYNILRLGPGFNNLNSRNQDYVFSPLDLIGRPLDPFLPHIGDLIDWFPKLLTFPVLFFIVIGIAIVVINLLVAAYKRNFENLNRISLTILLWSFIPLGIQMLLLKTFTARYILFSIPPLIIIASWAITKTLEFLSNKKILGLANNKVLINSVFILLFLPLSILFDFYLLTDPAKANLPKNERNGYLENWTAGYGLKEIAQYIDDRSREGFVVVGTEGSFGTLPDGLQIYLDKNRQVAIIGGKATVSAQLREAAKQNQTYFVANRSRYKFYADKLELIKEFPKVCCNNGEKDSILLFKVFPLDIELTNSTTQN